MRLFDEIKAEIMHDVKTSYGFDTSRTPDIIGRNTARAQALLTEMAFIHLEPNFGGTPRHPYRHPIIKQAINLIWFQNQDSVVYHSHISSLDDPRDHSRRQGEDLVAQLQRDFLKNARAHAGVPPEPVTGAGRLHQTALDAAVQDGLPPYPQDDHDSQIPMINISDES
ncbi:hypothetical protein BC827DRAFT_1377279 [Russula dissimulans]|nr:hypothetical protein BC827DRAFT_1377279 [Russula dissimulans]